MTCALCPTGPDGVRVLAAVLAPLRQYRYFDGVKWFAGFELMPLCLDCLLAAKTAGDVSTLQPVEVL